MDRWSVLESLRLTHFRNKMTERGSPAVYRQTSLSELNSLDLERKRAFPVTPLTDWQKQRCLHWCHAHSNGNWKKDGFFSQMKTYFGCIQLPSRNGIKNETPCFECPKPCHKFNVCVCGKGGGSSGAVTPLCIFDKIKQGNCLLTFCKASLYQLHRFCMKTIGGCSRTMTKNIRKVHKTMASGQKRARVGVVALQF